MGIPFEPLLLAVYYTLYSSAVIAGRSTRLLISLRTTARPVLGISSVIDKRSLYSSILQPQHIKITSQCSTYSFAKRQPACHLDLRSPPSLQRSTRVPQAPGLRKGVGMYASCTLPPSKGLTHQPSVDFRTGLRSAITVAGSRKQAKEHPWTAQKTTRRIRRDLRQTSKTPWLPTAFSLLATAQAHTISLT